MSLIGPNNHDIQKLHSEVNQLVNQRLTLTILAITVFGIIAAWLIPNQTPRPGTEIGSFNCVVSMLLTLILFALFLLTTHLTSMLRIITTYLDETGASDWEKDWALFRNKFSYLGYTRPISIIYLVLGVIASWFPYILRITYPYKLEPKVWLIICAVVGILYVIFVVGMGFKGWFASECKVRKKWKQLKNE